VPLPVEVQVVTSSVPTLRVVRLIWSATMKAE
jgi:hypothetical protein